MRQSRAGWQVYKLPYTQKNEFLFEKKSTNKKEKNGQTNVVTVSFARKWHIVYANNLLKPSIATKRKKKRNRKWKKKLHSKESFTWRTYQNTHYIFFFFPMLCEWAHCCDVGSLCLVAWVIEDTSQTSIHCAEKQCLTEIHTLNQKCDGNSLDTSCNFMSLNSCYSHTLPDTW